MGMKIYLYKFHSLYREVIVCKNYHVYYVYTNTKVRFTSTRDFVAQVQVNAMA